MVRKQKRIEYIYKYAHTITLRRIANSKKDWTQIVKSFSILDYPPEDVVSITIERGDSNGRIVVSFNVEEWV